MRNAQKIILLITLLLSFILSTDKLGAQETSQNDKKWTIVITSQDAEKTWNAMRLALFAQKQGKQVSVFFLGAGVNYSKISTAKFDINDLVEEFVESGGQVHACGLCLRLHSVKPSTTCPVGTMKMLFTLVDQAQKVLTF